MIPACSGFDEGPGANFTPPTLGEFMKKQTLEIKRLREAKAGAQVIKEAREFHERQARRHGINTNRGLAHFRASKMFTREGNRLQEMFDQGGQDHSELPPKAVMKAAKAAMMFHKNQAEKAGLDSDLGHAHVAAMEQHADIHKKAKQQHKQSQPEVGNGPMDSGGKGHPMQASAEGGPGSGPRSSGGSKGKSSSKSKGTFHAPFTVQASHMGSKDSSKMKAAQQIAKKFGGKVNSVEDGGFTDKTYHVLHFSDEQSAAGAHAALRKAGFGHVESTENKGGNAVRQINVAGHQKGYKYSEALPGHGSKQSPVPVPKKSEQPSQDIHDPNKPPVNLHPDDANKPLRKLQQTHGAHAGMIKASDEGGPGSGPRKGMSTGGTHEKNKTQTMYADKKSAVRESNDPNAELHNMMGDFLSAQNRNEKPTPGWKNSSIYSPPVQKQQEASIIIKEF